MNKSLKLLLAVTALFGLGFPLETLAKPARRNFSSSELARITFVPSSDRPRPTSRTGGGASRDAKMCPSAANPSGADPKTVSRKPLTLVVPLNYEALTTDERPTLLAYIPQSTDYPASDERQGMLLLKTAQESIDEAYRKLISLPNSGGIVQIPIPEDAPPLVIGQEYEWILTISCRSGGLFPPGSPTDSAIIKRVALDNALAVQLEGQTPSRQAELLGQNGIWYDTISNLAKARQEQLDDFELNQSWQNILTTMGLQSVSTAPLLDP